MMEATAAAQSAEAMEAMEAPDLTLATEATEATETMEEASVFVLSASICKESLVTLPVVFDGCVFPMSFHANGVFTSCGSEH